MKYYIKERHNPQTGVYYIACGKLFKKEANKMENSLYGFNIMIPFDTEQAYKGAIKKFNARV